MSSGDMFSIFVMMSAMGTSSIFIGMYSTRISPYFSLRVLPQPHVQPSLFPLINSWQSSARNLVLRSSNRSRRVSDQELNSSRLLHTECSRRYDLTSKLIVQEVQV